MECVFCNLNSNEKVIEENELAYAICDKCPENKGHTLIVSKRHINNYFDATPEEIKAINELLHKVKNILDKEFKPDAYNVEINIGEEAGQTIPHLHVHVIPRYKGDVENPRGGIRKLRKNF